MRKDWFPICALIYVVVALVFYNVWDTEWWNFVSGVIIATATGYLIVMSIIDWVRLR